MDREIGRLIDRLRATGALENTLVLSLSDNGASGEIMVRGDGHDRHAQCGTGATFLSIGPGLVDPAQYAFPAAQDLSPRKWHLHAADRSSHNSSPHDTQQESNLVTPFSEARKLCRKTAAFGF